MLVGRYAGVLYPVPDILDQDQSHLILDGVVQAVPYWGQVLEVGGWGSTRAYSEGPEGHGRIRAQPPGAVSS